jgi:hypothetical protein
MQDSFEDKLKNAWQEKMSTTEPIPGHEERFEMRLMNAQDKKQIHRIPRWPWLTLAAALVIGVILTIVVSEVKKTNHMAEESVKQDLPPELAAAQDFFKSRTTMDMSKLNTDDVYVQRFASDMKVLEEEYTKLEQILASNFNNEKVAEAMVNNYKFRLKLMERLQKYIEIQNQINNEKNGSQNAS